MRSVKPFLDPIFEIGPLSIFDVGSNFRLMRSVKPFLDPTFDVGPLSIFDVGSNFRFIRSVEPFLDPTFDVGPRSDSGEHQASARGALMQYAYI